MSRLLALGWVILFVGCFGSGKPLPSGTNGSSSQSVGQVPQPPPSQPFPNGAPGTGQVPAPSNPAVPVPAAPPELRAAFAAYGQQGLRSAEFIQALRAAAPSLPLVEVTTGDAELHWNSLTINQHKLGFDAIRIRSTLDEPADMYWAFSDANPIKAWYILPAQGSMQGFSSFESEPGFTVKGVELAPGSKTILQALNGGQVLPGQEYILWFALGSEPVPFQTAIRLSPAGKHGSDESLDAITKALGIETRYQEFEPTPQGVQAAFAAAHQLVQQNKHESNGFAAALRSVSTALPEVKGSAANETVWNQVSSAGSFEFAAVRFRFPASHATRLNLTFVSDGDLPRWGVLEVNGGAVEAEDFCVRANVAAEGQDLPFDNLAVFQNLTGIGPNSEYILWFTPVEGALPDMLHVAFSADLAGESTDAEPGAKQIAAACGWDLPAAANPEQMTALFRRCRSLWNPNREWSSEIARLIDGAIPDLPRPTLTESEVHWNNVAINGEAGFAAVVLEKPQPRPASLVYVVAKPAAPLATWFVRSPHVETALQSQRFPGIGIEFDGIDRTATPVIQFDVLDAANLQFGRSQVLLIRTEDGSPLTVQVAARWLPYESARGQLPSSARSVAAAIGLKADAAPALPGSRILSDDGSPLQSLVLRPAADEVIGGSADGALRIWNLGTGALTDTLESDQGAIRDVHIAWDGSICAAAHTASQRVSVWDLGERRLKHTLEWTEAQPQQLALSPDGRWLAACDTGYDNGSRFRPSMLALWDLSAPERPVTVWGTEFNYNGIEFNVANDRLFAGGWRQLPDKKNGTGIESVLQFLKLPNLEVEREFVEADTSSSWYDLALSPDGTRLYGSHLNGELEARDPVSGERLAITTQPGKLSEVIISADGRKLVTIGEDRAMRLWDAKSLQLRRLIEQPELEIQSAVIPADGATTICGGIDGTLRVWDLAQRADVPIAGNFTQQNRTNSIGMSLVPIPAGEFDMGTSDKDDPRQSPADQHPAHHVRITRPFYMSAHEVTVGQFRQFVDATSYQTVSERTGAGGTKIVNPQRLWSYSNGPELTWRSPGFPQTDDHPVVQVCWEDAVAFCEWLSKTEGATYRLPTEAEWEYACRAGSRTAWSWGDTARHGAVAFNSPDQSLVEQMPGYQWSGHWTDGFAMTSPVGTFLPNAFGLYDMHGNVWEFCSDWYDLIYYHYSPQDDPRGPTTGKARVVRGSSFLHFHEMARSARRNTASPDQSTWDQAFRVVQEWD